jgi:hypothetical protein
MVYSHVQPEHSSQMYHQFPFRTRNWDWNHLFRQATPQDLDSFFNKLLHMATKGSGFPNRQRGSMALVIGLTFFPSG